MSASLSDVNALREYIQNELSKVQVFMKTTNNSVGAMQDTDALLLDKFNKLTNAVEDLTTQISLQQKQIRELLQLVTAVSLDTPPERRSQSESEQVPVRSNITRYRPSSDEPVTDDPAQHDHDNDEAAARDT